MTEQPAPSDGSPDEPAARSGGRKRLLLQLVKIIGLLAGALAVFFCVRVLVREWPTISRSLASADVGLLVLAFVVGAVGMWFLAVLWWRCLAVFGTRRGLVETSGWYFAGELGKYLPGGVWTVVGRGELARRRGVPRSVAYATTMFSLLLMCVGGAVVAGVAAAFFVFGEGRVGPELLLLVLVPLGVVGVHPAVLGRVLALGSRLTRGRLDLQAPSWPAMLSLIAVAVPTWVLIGLQSVLVAQALGFEQQPARVVFAAVAAWIIGFLAIPVPAGAGIREVVFVLASGLAQGPATAVAAVCRVFLILVDALGGVIGLAMQRRRAADRTTPADVAS